MPVRLRPAHSLSSLSLTPLIDVVFLLLVFFLVATRYDAEENRLDILLPAAEQTQPMFRQSNEIVVHVDRAGNVLIGDRPVVSGELESVLQRAAGARSRDCSVVIRADKRCEWESVVRVMDACHAVGIRDIYPMTSVES